MLSWLSPSAQSTKASFHVVCTEPPIQSSSNLTITCYTNSTLKTAIPCRYSWWRVKQNNSAPIPHCKSNTYLCEPSDIGCVILATVTSLDEEFPGTATLSFGPVVIDAMIRRTVEKMLHSARGTFPVKVREKDCLVEVREGEVRICEESTGADYRFQYSTGEPAVELSPNDALRLTLGIPRASQPSFNSFLHSLTSLSSRIFPPSVTLCFVSRIQRDMFLLLYKAFCAKKSLPSAYLLHSICGFANTEQFNYLLEIDSLKYENGKMLEIKQKAEDEAEKYKAQVARLQEEMKNIKETYTKIIQERWGFEIGCRDLSLIQNKEELLLDLKDEDANRDPIIEFAEERKDIKNLMPTSPKTIRLKTDESDDLQFSKSHKATTPRNANSRTIRKTSQFYEDDDLKAKLELEIKKTRDLTKLVEYYTTMCSTLDDTERVNKELKKENQILKSKIDELNKQIDQVNTYSSSNLDEEQGKSKSKSSGGSLSHQLEAYKQGYNKYKKKYEQTLQQIKLLRRGNEQLSRSRDMSLRMDAFLQQQRNTLKEQCDLLSQQNKRLQEMCGKYWQRTDETLKLKAQLQELKKKAGGAV